ncbi:MAG: hypothetical protein ACJ8OJ_11740 [Povalibacter sp.]
MRTLITVCGLMLMAGCGGNASSGPATPATPASSSDVPANGAFIGRAWMSTTQGKPLGTLLVFLPNRSLLMDSCFETYRISEWGVAGDHIRWREDTIPIEAVVKMPSPDELVLQVVGQDQPQSYIAASVPYVCPDMPK